MELKSYRKLLKEITEGFSSYYIEEKLRYIKHQSTADLVDFDDVYQMYFDRARNKGLPTEEEIFSDLAKDEIWTEKDDAEIDSQKFYLESLIKNKKNVVLKGALQQINNQIKEAEEKVLELTQKKASLVSNSCEMYATNRANDFYIVNSFFKDKELSDPMFTQEEYEYMDGAEASKLIKTYNEFHGRFSEENIQKLTLQGFYRIYYAFSETASDFFGKPILYLTNIQLYFIMYTRIFKNIFEQNDDIPERIMDDPAALLDFANSSEAREEMKKKFDGDNAASTIVGASQEDMEELGISPNQGVSLSEAAKKKGGSLDMKDLMDLSGA